MLNVIYGNSTQYNIDYHAQYGNGQTYNTASPTVKEMEQTHHTTSPTLYGTWMIRCYAIHVVHPLL